MLTLTALPPLLPFPFLPSRLLAPAELCARRLGPLICHCISHLRLELPRPAMGEHDRESPGRAGELLRLHLAMAGKSILRIVGELLHPIAQLRRMHAQRLQRTLCWRVTCVELARRLCQSVDEEAGQSVSADFWRGHDAPVAANSFFHYCD
jgi:hypothetical protein